MSENNAYYTDEWGCFTCPDCGVGCHISWDECAVCGHEIDSEDEIPHPDDDGWEEWLAEQNSCDNCGSDRTHREELRFGHLAGDLVEVCSNCGYPYLHEQYGSGGRS